MTPKTNHSVIGETNIVSSPWKTIIMPNKVVYMMQKESSYRPISLLFGNSKIFQGGSSHIWISSGDSGILIRQPLRLVQEMPTSHTALQEGGQADRAVMQYIYISTLVLGEFSWLVEPLFAKPETEWFSFSLRMNCLQ